MPEILIASCPPIGHISPLLNVARGLVARGDRVTFLTSARHADRIRAVGAAPRSLPLGADYDDSAFDAQLPRWAETSGIARINFDGAVQRALSDGVPLVVAGRTEDKPEVAARVAYFGAGIDLRTGTPTAAAVRRAVREVLGNVAFRDNARRLRSAYATHDGVTEIAAVVDEVIERRTATLGHVRGRR